MPAILAVLLTAYLYLFAADAAITTIGSVLGLAFGGLWLVAVSLPLALLCMLASAFVYLLMLATPLVPKRAFLPPVLAIVASNTVAVPLIWFLPDVNLAGLLFGLAQLAFAVAALLVVRRLTGGRWYLRAEDLDGPAFSMPKSLLFAGFTALLAPSLALGTVLETMQLIDHKTGGFVVPSFSGIDVVSKAYSRGDKEVRLVATMHFGQRDKYDALMNDLPQDGSAVILAEGVTDNEDRLGEVADREELAAKVGLDAQPSELFVQEGVKTIRADIDVEDLEPETLELLRAIEGLFGADDSTPATRLAFAATLQEMDQEAVDAFWADVIDKRNEVLLDHLWRALERHDLAVVPWGAAHMKGLQAALLDQGFELVSAETKPLIVFGEPRG